MAEPNKTRYEYSRIIAKQGVGFEDNDKLVFGTDSDASVYFDGTRITHLNAEEIFRKNITIPLYGTTSGSLAEVAKRQIVFMPDRAARITALRVGWTQLPASVDTVAEMPLWIGKRLAAGGASQQLLSNSNATSELFAVDMMLINTAYFSHEYVLTANTAVKTLAAGDVIYASLTVPGTLTADGRGGALTLEYEVYG